MISAERYHDISCGHRVHGHEGKCNHLHGHNYRITFIVEPLEGLDDVGRVLDFSAIKSKLCMWLEDNWDHKMLLWEDDPMLPDIARIDPSAVAVPFNPTAENMAQWLVEVLGPSQLEGTGCKLTGCKVEETRKCSATYSK